MPSALLGLGLRCLRPLCVFLHQPWRTMPAPSSVVLPVCMVSVVPLSRQARRPATNITLGSGGRSEDLVVHIGGFESVSIVDRIRPNRARLIEVWVERSESGVLKCLLGRLLFAGKVVGMMIDRWPAFGSGGLVCRSESHGKFSVQTKLLLGSKVGDRECFRTPLTATAAGHESRARRIWFQTCVLGRILIQA